MRTLAPELRHPGRMIRKSAPLRDPQPPWPAPAPGPAARRAVADETALAQAILLARSRADMTQEQVARAMGTAQAVVARLESGRTMPSTRTLERFARATGTRLCIRFEPIGGFQPAGRQKRAGVLPAT